MPERQQKTTQPIESEVSNTYTIFMRIISVFAHILFFYTFLARSLTAMDLDALITQELDKKFLAEKLAKLLVEQQQLFGLQPLRH